MVTGMKSSSRACSNGAKMKIVFGFGEEIGLAGANEDNESCFAKATADVMTLLES
jgi:hypothetical protein